MINVSGDGGPRVIAELRHQPPHVQPRRRSYAAQHGVVAAPRPVLGQVADACPHGVEHHVASQFQQVRLALHDDGLESALKNVTDPVVRAVVPLGIDAVELAHTGAQVAVDGLYNDMKVVVHQAVGVAEPVMAGTHLAQ